MSDQTYVPPSAEVIEEQILRETENLGLPRDEMGPLMREMVCDFAEILGDLYREWP